MEKVVTEFVTVVQLYCYAVVGINIVSAYEM
jgi:hypothetical protein